MKDTKIENKMIIEILIIAIALCFLEYELLLKIKNKEILLIILSIITSLELIIKLIKDISLKNDKLIFKIIRIFMFIINILVLFSLFYNFVINKNIILNYIFKSGVVINIIYLLIKGILKLIDIKHAKGKKYINVKEALFNIIFSLLMLISLLFII